MLVYLRDGSVCLPLSLSLSLSHTHTHTESQVEKRRDQSTAACCSTHVLVVAKPIMAGRPIDTRYAKGFLRVVTNKMAGRMTNWCSTMPTDTASTNLPSWEKAAPMSATLATDTPIRLATPTGVSLLARGICQC